VKAARSKSSANPMEKTEEKRRGREKKGKREILKRNKSRISFTANIE